MILKNLYIAESKKSGRGVFTKQNIKAGSVIETSPVLVMNIDERKLIEQTLLTNYIFEWGATRRKAALAMGFVSMYNHDYNSNCEYEMEFDKNIMSIKTVRDIKKGEELYINYNGTFNNKTKVWFDK